jgi:uncharacterized protein YeaO (DUF488 family)
MVLRFHRMSSRSHIGVARVFDDAGPDDGQRVLVDRLWPRGFRKGDPRVGRWISKVAPSTDLRKWYSHEAGRFDEFASRYAAELETEEGAAALDELRQALRGGPVTLVTAARDLDASHVAVLARLLSCSSR